MDVREEPEAEGNHSLCTSPRAASPAEDAEQQGARTARKQLVLVVEMNVEGRAADLGAIENLRDGDAIVRLLANE